MLQPSGLLFTLEPTLNDDKSPGWSADLPFPGCLSTQLCSPKKSKKKDVASHDRFCGRSLAQWRESPSLG